MWALGRLLFGGSVVPPTTHARWNGPVRRPRNGIFELLAPIYDQFARGYGLSRALDALEPLAGRLLLDLGGGTGRLAASVERAPFHLLLVATRPPPEGPSG